MKCSYSLSESPAFIHGLSSLDEILEWCFWHAIRMEATDLRLREDGEVNRVDVEVVTRAEPQEVREIASISFPNESPLADLPSMAGGGGSIDHPNGKLFFRWNVWRAGPDDLIPGQGSRLACRLFPA